MINNEQNAIFERKWQLLMDKIYNSTLRCKRKRAIKLGSSDYYFTRFSHNKDILQCYYVEEYIDPWNPLKSLDNDVFKNFEVFTFVSLTKLEIYDYCINGWNKTSDLERIIYRSKEIRERIDYLEFLNEGNDDEEYYFDETRQFPTYEDYCNFSENEIKYLNEELEKNQKEIEKLNLERKFVQILKKYFKLGGKNEK